MINVTTQTTVFMAFGKKAPLFHMIGSSSQKRYPPPLAAERYAFDLEIVSATTTRVESYSYTYNTRTNS